MALGFGPGFRAARREWRYQPDGAPVLWKAIAVTVVGMIVMTILQSAAGFGALFLFFDRSTPELFQTNFVKAILVGLPLAGFLTILATWWMIKFAAKDAPRGLPIYVPNLGIAGWVTVIICFCLVVLVIYFGLFTITGIDPATYAPSSDGLNDPNSSAGLAEKALADLASEPLLFALAVPGVAIAVPIAEEMLFRGPLFAALTKSRVGPWGAVVITAAVWSLVHVSAPWMFIAIIFAMGLVLGALLLRFGSVMITIVCHCIWNAYTSFAILGGLATQ
jgi:membrane protease YdiL (CAAX protease family)